MILVTAAELESIHRQAREEYPGESCGVLLVRDGERRLFPCRNVQDERHRAEPDKFPRTARNAYYMHEADVLAFTRLEGQGFSVAAIYHSHIDAGAYFSETDKRQALLGMDPQTNDPIYPEAAYIVTSVMSGKVDATAAFRWSDRQRDFVPVELRVASAGDAERAQ